MEQERDGAIADVRREVSKLRDEHRIMFTVFGFFQRTALLNAESSKTWGNVALLWGVLAFFVAAISTLNVIVDNAIYRIVVLVLGTLLSVYILILWISVIRGFRAQQRKARQIQQEMASVEEYLKSLITQTYGDHQADE